MKGKAPSSNAKSEKPVSCTGTIHTLGYGEDCLANLASFIINEHKDNLPDLTHVTALLYSSQAITSFRKLLLSNAQALGYPALLGPEIITLRNWISQQSYNEQPVLTEHQRALMLVEALVNHTYLYGHGSPWTLADSLLGLFDELSEQHIRLPEKFEDFLQQIGNAYAADNNNMTTDTEALTGEARLVHTLWQAWHKQMESEGVIDQHTSYLLNLTSSQQRICSTQNLYLAGYSQFSPAEIHWLNSILATKKASLWLQGSTPPDKTTDYHPDCAIRALVNSINRTITFPAPVDDYSHCLNSIFCETDITMQERARILARKYPVSPVASRLSLYEARSAEQEAFAIDLQARLWWLEGKHKIGIVTENRRLARRVRALLERAGIELQDAAGWALSTTSASATLERWLETIEEDFAYQPLLDLLKSPFFQPGSVFGAEEKGREDLLATVFRFEQGVILKENIGRGLERYRQHTRYRQDRLTEELASEYNDIYPLLDILAEAARPLAPFLNKNIPGNPTEIIARHSPKKIFDALNKSLAILGLNNSFLADDAGKDILDELHHMQNAASNSEVDMSWTEFRAWLGRTLECFNFQPNTHGDSVQLMSLAQSPLCQFDALIIAGAEQEYLPGKLNQSPFFNDGVRQVLGLPSQTKQLSQRYYHFRRLLESSPHIVITRCTEKNSEDVVCSPWLERIKSFHAIAYNDDLINKKLTELVAMPETLVTNTSTPLPKGIAANPTAHIDSSLAPKTISASAYQQLMDCPYQFFAARCLGLEPPETIREMLEKSDYGERVHLCLHAFHSGVENLPGPFTQSINTKSRGDAILCLISIAEAVFAHDLEDNFLHRGWLKRWHDLIPLYIDWQITRQGDWQVYSTEVKVETNLTDTTTILRGRLDRVDHSKASPESDKDISGLGVIDYKTGNVANEEDVLGGESIQLPFYALLAEQHLQQPVSRVEYVSLDTNGVQTKTLLREDTLSTLARQVELRLAELVTSIQSGASMSAWGDKKTCEWCQMSGVCRRETWLDPSPGSRS